MNIKRMTLPIIFIVIGLVASVVLCLFTCVLKVPTITEAEFNYSVTYKLNGEIKTFEGVYKCSFVGFSDGVDPLQRVYHGEYADYGLATHSHSYTIAKENGFDICISTRFNDSYLMNDTKNDYYIASLPEPKVYFYDEEGIAYDEEEMLNKFNVEIISWEYPEPVQNTFVFAGFSILHSDSMIAMIWAGVFAIAACVLFVKKDKTISYKPLDKISTVFNFIIGFAGIPLATLLIGLMPLAVDSGALIYQIFLCLPVCTAFTIAASIALRRKGFSKSGFFVQLVCPAFFATCLIVEYIITFILYAI